MNETWIPCESLHPILSLHVAFRGHAAVQSQLQKGHPFITSTEHSEMYVHILALSFLVSVLSVISCLNMEKRRDGGPLALGKPQPPLLN